MCDITVLGAFIIMNLVKVLNLNGACMTYEFGGSTDSLITHGSATGSLLILKLNHI